MGSDEKPDVVDQERELREREQAIKEHDSHERNPEDQAGDSLDAERRPAPPGPEAQQPRG